MGSTDAAVQHTRRLADCESRSSDGRSATRRVLSFAAQARMNLSAWLVIYSPAHSGGMPPGFHSFVAPPPCARNSWA